MTSNATVIYIENLSELVAQLYREALQDDSLDADSDFFEAGGDSMAAFQITARLSEELGVEVPVALVFAFPTAADLASVVELDGAAC